MKKKIWIGISAALVIVALVLMLVFALGGDDTELPVEQANLPGVWKVVAYTANNNVSMIDDQYFVFDEKSASFYRGDLSAPAMSSAYVYEGTKIKMTDANRSYEVNAMSDTFICLYESPTVCMLIMRCPGDSFTVEVCTAEQVEGTWNVMFRKLDTPVQDEYFRLEDGVMTAYRNGVTEPFMTADYTYENDLLTVPRLSQSMRVFRLSDDHIVFVEVATGNPWDLSTRK